MYKLITISVLAIIALLLFPRYTKGDYEILNSLNIEVKPLSVKEMAYLTAMQFGQDPTLISKIMMCESGGIVASHDGGRGVNVTGIHDNTFNYWLPKYEKDTGETLDITSTYDQLKMMSWAFSKGDTYRRQWTTYRAYKNGGTYTFYSILLKNTYTSRCL